MSCENYNIRFQHETMKKKKNMMVKRKVIWWWKEMMKRNMKKWGRTRTYDDNEREEKWDNDNGDINGDDDRKGENTYDEEKPDDED